MTASVKKVEVENVVTLVNAMTEEARKEFVEDMVFKDSTNESPMPRLNIAFPVMKQALGTTGKNLPQGTIHIPDLDDYAFPDGLTGIVIAQHKERAYEPEGSNMAECTSYDMKQGTKFGNCMTCSKCQWLDNNKPECSTVIKYIVLIELEGEPALVQVKVKGSSYSEMNKRWKTLVAKTRGRFNKFLIKFNSQNVENNDSKGRKRSYYIWTADVVKEVKPSEATLEFFESVKNKVIQFHREKFQVLKYLANLRNEESDESISFAGDAIDAVTPAIEHTPRQEASDDVSADDFDV